LAVPIRVGAAKLEFSPASAGALVCVGFAVPAVVVIAAFLAEALAQVLNRQRDTRKWLYNVGKEILICTAAALAGRAAGLHPMFAGGHEPPIHLWSTWLGLGAGAVAYGVLEEIISNRLYALVTHTPGRKLLVMHQDARLLGRGAALVLASLTIWLYS